MEITGKLIVIGDVQTVGASGSFTKREFVIEVPDEKYPQKIKLELVKDKTSLLDSFVEGDNIKAEFNLRGNEYNGKYYVSLVAWKLSKEGASVPTRPPATAPNNRAPASNTRASAPTQRGRVTTPSTRQPSNEVSDEDVPF